MAQVYATFANDGRKVPLVAIRQVVDATGTVRTDVNIGSGYKYAVLVDEARLRKSSIK